MDSSERHENWLIELDNRVKAIEASDLSYRLVVVENDYAILKDVVEGLVNSIGKIEAELASLKEQRTIVNVRKSKGRY